MTTTKGKASGSPAGGSGKATSIGAPHGEVVIYEDPAHGVRVDVRLEQDTLWLNLNQIAELFGRDKSVISRHLRNVFREGELDRESTVAKFATVQQEGGRTVTRQIEHFNLDAILSVGYRVNSKRGTQFRIWATRVLRDHLLKGYTVNARRLEQLRQTIRVVSKAAGHPELSSDQAGALLRVLRDYSYALDLLDAYDHNRLPPPSEDYFPAEAITPDEARRVVAVLKERFGGSPLFGQEAREGALESSLATVFQTAAGRDLYPSLEEKAAHLLYFLVKNHPFVDGNKRIGAALFLRFLDKNGALIGADGEPAISQEGLVAVTLLIAESAAEDRDTVIRVLMALIRKNRAGMGERR
ncbi:RhuM family protein [Deferrisoma camini]|uniref:RhuM family protein n=1 Tax=Deferrisoma camini TaxID=1035120 RepID=UPI0009FCA985|nr:RhuM family protein [Deferrisoma camini]